MDAVVEVATACVAARVSRLTVIAARLTTFVTALSQVVATFATPVLSMGSHSISAVAPDLNFSDRSVALGSHA